MFSKYLTLALFALTLTLGGFSPAWAIPHKPMKESVHSAHMNHSEAMSTTTKAANPCGEDICLCDSQGCHVTHSLLPESSTLSYTPAQTIIFSSTTKFFQQSLAATPPPPRSIS